MKRSSVWGALAVVSLLAGVAALAWPQTPAGPGFSGGSYVTTIKDSSGNFSSRSILTLHADRTLEAVDSAQQGPLNYFSNQLGTWEPAGNHRIRARTLDFLYPPGSGMARADYVITFASDRCQIAGTITVSAFPLQGENGDEGSLIGTFTFEGEWVKP